MDRIKGATISALMFVGYGVTYAGGLLLHFMAVSYFFGEFGPIAGLIALGCPVLPVIAAVILEMVKGNFLGLYVVGGYLVGPLLALLGTRLIVFRETHDSTGGPESERTRATPPPKPQEPPAPTAIRPNVADPIFDPNGLMPKPKPAATPTTDVIGSATTLEV
jgi:hypothetical protein